MKKGAIHSNLTASSQSIVYSPPLYSRFRFEVKFYLKLVESSLIRLFVLFVCSFVLKNRVLWKRDEEVFFIFFSDVCTVDGDVQELGGEGYS